MEIWNKRCFFYVDQQDELSFYKRFFRVVKMKIRYILGDFLLDVFIQLFRCLEFYFKKKVFSCKKYVLVNKIFLLVMYVLNYSFALLFGFCFLKENGFFKVQLNYMG